MFAESISKRWMVCLTLLALYAPYSRLFFVGEQWNWHVVRIWPFLPGVAISVLMKPVVSSHAWIPEGATHALFITALLLGISLFLLLRLRRAFYPAVAGLFVLSCGLSLIVYALIKA